MSLAEKWIPLQPKLRGTAGTAEPFTEHALRLVRAQEEQDPEKQRLATLKALETTLAARLSWPAQDRPRLTAAAHVLTDLVQQGWRARLVEKNVEVCAPENLQSDPAAEKARVQHQELIKRDEQLARPAVRTFVRAMERRQLYGHRFVSIFSLIRDGQEFAEALRKPRGIPRAERVVQLRSIIDPYLQLVTTNTRCEHTGLLLQDIWRYFRHTWTNQYTSIPGRTMMFLVRDRAAVNHPVIGIGALGSSIIQIKERDAWIGWHPGAFFEHITENPTPEIGRWLQHTARTALSELYVGDLLEDRVVSQTELCHPTPETIVRLRNFGAEERKLHHRYVRAQEHKGREVREGDAGAESHWVVRARTHLFRSKRALTLADLLAANAVLDQYLGTSPTAEEVAALLDNREGRRATARILRKAKADRVGIAMADIIVCGAIPPYNPVLGGKLVSLLALSPEIVEAYRHRYAGAESEIASSMAGRSISRPADLVFLGTTSLYSVGSSQYNRVEIPAERLGGPPDEKIQYLELGRSEAFGTSHYSSETVQQLVSLVHQSKAGQRVNSIFGEGVSPKLRKIRNGLDELGFPSDDLLRHGRSRIVYGVSLIRNLREYLLGMDSKPDYLFSAKGKEATAAVAEWWRERWLTRRIESDEVLEAVAQHTLVSPVRHGARVRLPSDDSEVPLNFGDS